MLANWDRIKREVEGRGADDPFGDVPENLPGLLYARKLLRRADSEAEGEARRRGPAVVETADSDAAGTRIPDDEARERAEAWLGDLLLELVRVGRHLGVDPELAVRAAARRAVLPE